MNITDRFTRKTSRPYTESGEKRQHEVELLCEVVSTDEVGFSWKTLEVLSETNRPTEFNGFIPEKGETAWFGWEAALGRGDVRKVA